jgi:hypothetical protein
MTDFDRSLRALEGDTRSRERAALDLAQRTLRAIATLDLRPGSRVSGDLAIKALADIAELLAK